MLTALAAFFVFLTPLSSFSEDLPEIAISISFDMGNGVMEGKTSITFRDYGEALIHAGSLKIKSLRYNGNLIEPVIKDGELKIRTEKYGILTIEYECTSGKNDSCIIDKTGIFLTGNWCPSIGGRAFHKLTALVPEDFLAVSEAEEIEMERSPKGNLFSFRFPHPVEGINFIASRFEVKRETLKGIELYTYFFSEDTNLADTYLEYTKKYLELYEGIVGKYPYKRFSVVEHFLPTGYSMPTFTLLGQAVVRLPFIVKTSLGHEILHQWLGNLVYVDYEKGNWSEGLTTYLSDHLYEEQEGRGWQYRKQMLIDYESYVIPDEEFSLRDFRSRIDFASRAIGYGKSAMVFHMLKRLVGEDVFYKSLRGFIRNNSFKRASWDDIKVAFEAESGKKLDWFFEQWLNEKGSPTIEVKNIEIKPKGLQYILSFEVIQREKMYIFDMPFSVKTEKGETNQILRINDKKQNFEVLTDGNPERLVLDENYDIFRKLSVEEIPPVIAKLLSDEKGLLVLPEQEKESTYSGMVNLYKKKGYTIKRPEEVKNGDKKVSHLLILSYENPVAKRLFGMINKPPQGFVLMIKKNPFNLSKVAAIANASSADETDASLGKISHYGKYSMVAFKEGKNTEKKIEESQRGWDMTLGEMVTGVETAKAITLDDVIDKVSGKKIIYVGEQHDRYEHHLTQFEAIKRLFRKNPMIAIGMEMFQRPFQKALDEYIEGKMEEREFLKSSEYFKRWGFDYNLYKDILRFARDERIPVIALNIRKEIADKVSKQGTDSLTGEEKKELPDSMDLTDDEYRKMLREVFEKHEGLGERDFDNFYQSQIIWDETMAQSIDEYLKKNPYRQMVVITGGGHLVFGSGIPKRVFRRNRMDYAIILNNESVEKKVADFILFPQPVKMVSAPKLMTILKEEEGKVRIAGFPERSVSEKAGLKRDDIIVSLDDERIKGIDDVQIFLFYKKLGDTIKVRVLRKRFLFGVTELRFDVTL